MSDEKCSTEQHHWCDTHGRIIDECIQSLQARIVAVEAERDELKKRVGELDGIIKSAPHSELCNSRYYIVGEGKNYPCDCFKSEIKTPTGRG